MNLDLKSVFRFLSLLLISLFAIYYLPAGVASAWLVGVLVLYWFSNDEPFWLALFLVLSDGFFSFFGFYQVTLSVLPGMPPIEIGEFYVILSVLKARYKQPAYPIFYKNFLVAMGCYIIVLIILGITIGINGEMNAYFRILKVTMPFLLYYSIPKLIRNRDDYMRFFAFVFPVIIFASAAQLFEIIMQEPFSSYLGAKEFLGEELREGEAMRSFYNPGILLLTMFGSLYFSSKTNNKFNSIYVSVLAIISFSMAFLSATRGWILGFGLTLILYAVFVARLKLGRMLAFASIGILFFIVLMRIPDINLQLVNAYDRFSTVEKISEGDVTAGGTQSRTTEYSPRVLQKWAQSPLVGFGFSDDNREYDLSLIHI